MPTTSNMNLELPTVGPNGTVGPTWADDLNSALDTIDSHDHSSGKGVSIPLAGIFSRTCNSSSVSNGNIGIAKCQTEFTTALTSPTGAVTGLSISITTIGRPVYLAMGPYTDVPATGYGYINQVNATGSCFYGIYRDGTRLFAAKFDDQSYLAPTIVGFDVPTAASHTYDVRIWSGSTGDTVKINNYALYVLEW